MIVITEEERDEYLRLYKYAQEAPVVLLFGVHDVNQEAWNAVRAYGLMLSKKYNYAYETHGINNKGEVIEI